MVEIEVFTVMVPYSDCGETIKCDAIEYQGKIWLVPEWNEFPALGVKKPARIVHLGRFGLKPTQSSLCRYIGEAMLLPKSVLEGRAPPQSPIEVVESPEIEVQIPFGSQELH